MKHGSLFSGIGGFDLAAEWMGWENEFHCEWNEFGRKVLKYYWPAATSYEDITKTDFNIYRGRIDILSGGFPCQPYSTAGKRLGKEDDRHLWPEMLRAIREIKPKYVVAENVSGLISWNDGLVFNEVQADLENEGYEVQPCVLPAAAVNAPHKRDRVWFVAYCKNIRPYKSEDTDQREKHKPQYRESIWNRFNADGKGGTITNTDGNGDSSSGTSKKIKRDRENFIETKGQGRIRGEWINGLSGLQRDVTNSDGELLQGGGYTDGSEKTERHFSASFCGNAWENFPTQPPICSGNDGISERLDGITFPKWRSESIKAYGNAIVPQVAHQIFKALIN